MEEERIRTHDGTELFLTFFPGREDAPLVLVVHGITSHQGWYLGLGRALSERGFNVGLVDRRGCGRSGGRRGHAPSWKTLVEDHRLVMERLKEKRPGVPVHLVGISLGGVLTLTLALAHPDLVSRQVILCPGLAARLKLPLVRRLRQSRRRLTRPEKLYEIPFTVDMLTEREDWRRVLAADPLRTKEVSARFLVEFFRAQMCASRRIAGLRSPVFCMLAGRDTIIDNERVMRILERGGQDRYELEVFEDAHHVAEIAQ